MSYRIIIALVIIIIHIDLFSQKIDKLDNIDKNSFDIKCVTNKGEDSIFYIFNNEDIYFNLTSTFNGKATFGIRYTYHFALKISSLASVNHKGKLLLYEFKEKDELRSFYGLKCIVYYLDNAKLKSEKLDVKSLIEQDSNRFFFNLKSIENFNTNFIIEVRYMVSTKDISEFGISVNNDFTILNSYFKITIPDKYVYDSNNIIPSGFFFNKGTETGPMVGYKNVSYQYAEKKYCTMNNIFLSNASPLYATEKHLNEIITYKLKSELNKDY